MGQYKQHCIELGQECCNFCGDFFYPDELRVKTDNPYKGDRELTCFDCYTPQTIGGDDCNGFPPACGYMDGPAWDELPELEDYDEKSIYGTK